jgi:hypothetical protein
LNDLILFFSNIDSTEKIFNTNLCKYNSAEKGLEEALDHVDKLKEDMNNLCDDIDFLFKKQNNNSSLNENLNSTLNYGATSNDDLIDWNMNDEKKELKSLNEKKRNFKNKCIICLHKKTVKKSNSLFTSLNSLKKLISKNEKNNSFKFNYYFNNYKKIYCHTCSKRFNK